MYCNFLLGLSCLLLQVTEHICKLQEYVNGMARLQVDEHEYAYLKAITLFSAGEFNYQLFVCSNEVGLSRLKIRLQNSV